MKKLHFIFFFSVTVICELVICRLYLFNSLFLPLLSCMVFSLRWSVISALLRAARGPTARRATWGLTRKHTGANTHSSVISRAVERPSSPHTVSRSMSVCTPRRSPLSVMCKAVRRPSTLFTGQPTQCVISLYKIFSSYLEKYFLWRNFWTVLLAVFTSEFLNFGFGKPFDIQSTSQLIVHSHDGNKTYYAVITCWGHHCFGTLK